MYYIINGLKINIKSDVLRDLKKYYYSSWKYETGGILLGKFNKENKVIEIAEVYELKSNLFSRILYRRNAKKAQKIINKRWRQTAGVINYVGEWHTHPGMQAIPSTTDLNSLSEISIKVRDSLPGTLLLIVGEAEKINLVVQCGNAIKMQLITEDESEEE